MLLFLKNAFYLKKCIMVSTEVLSGTAVFNIDNNKYFNQNIRIEDTEDWSENSSMPSHFSHKIY